MAPHPESMIDIAAAGVGAAIVGGALEKLPVAIDTQQGLLLAAGCAIAAFAAYRAAFAGRGILLRSMHPHALGLLAALVIALVVSAMMAYLAIHAAGVALMLCIAGAASPPLAAGVGWYAAGRGPGAGES